VAAVVFGGALTLAMLVVCGLRDRKASDTADGRCRSDRATPDIEQDLHFGVYSLPSLLPRIMGRIRRPTRETQPAV
jgi:hypothetical protein